MISMFVFAGMIPTTALVVDGSTRTLTCVDVVPAAGTTVPVGGGGSGVSLGFKVGEGGKVEVTTNSVGVAASITSTEKLHPAQKIASQHIEINFFIVHEL